MDGNMVNVINKIKEMQKKLNIINSNIDEIKNRKPSEENKITNDDFLNNTKTENNNYPNNIINTKSYSSHQKKIKNSSNYNYFKMNRTYNRNKYLINYENFSKFDNDIFPINNKMKENILDKNSINSYLNKKNKGIKRNRASSSSMDISKKINLNNSKRENKIKDYFYEKNLKENNKNDYYLLNQNHAKKSSNSNINIFTATKKNAKAKNFLNERYFKKNNFNDYNYNKVNKEKQKYLIFSGKTYDFLENDVKNIEINGNKSLHNNEIIFHNNYLYDNDKDNSNTFQKIEMKNHSFRSPKTLYMNNKNLINNINKNKNYTISEYSNSKIWRNMSFNHRINRNNRENESIYDNKYEQFQHVENPVANMKKYISKKNDIDYQQIVMDIIDITNKYNKKENNVNVYNIIDEYKLLLHNSKKKDKFILKLTNEYNKLNNTNLEHNDLKSLIPIWNWIIENNNNANRYKNNEEREYIELCYKIMKQYKLNNINQLKIFINKSLIKNKNNDNFLEGIKKILSV